MLSLVNDGKTWSLWLNKANKEKWQSIYLPRGGIWETSGPDLFRLKYLDRSEGDEYIWVLNNYHSPQYWEKHFNMKILDADGWNMFPKLDFGKPLSRVDFVLRSVPSTVQLSGNAEYESIINRFKGPGLSFNNLIKHIGLMYARYGSHIIEYLIGG